MGFVPEFAPVITVKLIVAPHVYTTYVHVLCVDMHPAVAIRTILRPIHTFPRPAMGYEVL